MFNFKPENYSHKLMWMPLFFLIFFISSCTTTLYLVRHAEKLNTSSNTPLSPAGEQRALALRDTLINKGIDSIFVSTFLRTQQTALPLSLALNEVRIIYNKDTSLVMANHLKNLKGKDVLVVGHSDNIPQIFQAITGDTIQIDENTFNRLFKIKISRGLTTKITYTKTKYGN